MKKEMLINVLQAEECRIAILENGILEELYVERSSHESYVGNIYKGRIVNIEPSIQAAFVDFGVGRNGFLHISDVEPTYYRHLEGGRYGDRDDFRSGGRDRGRGGFFEGIDLDEDDEPAPRQPRPQAEPPRPVIEQPPPRPSRPVASVVMREVIPPSPRQTPTRTNPPQAPDFAAGVDLDLPPAQELQPPQQFEQPSPAQAPAPAEIDPPEQPVESRNDPDPPRKEKPQLTAIPGTEIEEDQPRARRRSRSTGTTRRRKPAGETPADADAPAKDDEDKPRVMDSAERRTTEKNDGPEAAHEIAPLSGTGYDADLFFPPPLPMPASAPPPPAKVEEAPPPLPRAPEPPRQEAPRQEAPRLEPPRRARPKTVHGSIEAQLEADLRAAEIGEDSPAEQREAPREQREAPRQPVEVAEKEEDLDDDLSESQPEPDLDPEFDTRPRREHGRAGDRDRDRGRGRNDRDRDRGRGRRPGQGGGGGRPGTGRPKPKIEHVFKRGQEVIVQVIKEGIGSKGPTLSTYISIPGRYLVLMPCLNRTGVSRKIEDEEQRRRLRQMFNELKPPKGLGFIMRTAAIDKNKREVHRDLVYLSRLWQVIVRRIRKIKSPAEIYQESEMVTRTIRDNFSADIDTIWVDEPAAFAAAQEFMQVVMPRYADRIKLYEGQEPLFHKFGLEEEITRIQQKKVPLASGGSIVIEQTEALVAIDVNSGNFRADNNAEETAYQMNLQAAREIARQLRLRDLGGVIVNDFIDMREEKHRRGVEKALRDAMRRDRARTKILKISQFGIIEMTRQRIRPSLKRSGYQDCPHCKGNGHVKSAESMALEIMRLIQLGAHRETVHRIEITVAPEVADYLHNRKRREIVKLEEAGEVIVQVRSQLGVPGEHLEFVCLDHNSNEVRLNPPELPGPRTRR